MKLEIRASAAAVMLMVMNVAAHAAELAKTFDIAEQAAATGLNEFARQGDVTLAFSYDLVATERTRAVHGSYPTLEALSRLLQGTKLGFSRIGDKTIAIGLASSGDHGDTKSGALHFSIPGESLDKAIKDFQAQSGLGVSAPPNLIAGKSGHAVKGAMSPTDAMRLMLKDSGLSYSVQNDGTLLIREDAGKKQAQSVDAGPEQSQEAAGRQGLAEILVKGSRIMNVDVTRTEDDTQPYYIFNSQQIEQSGAVNAEDFLKNMLTMNTVFSTQSQAVGGPLTTSSINLRGLGTNETLVLIDGRRSSGVELLSIQNSNQPDINGIPLAAIERIEVLPSSASAIYGGAAVGGVVNIILKKNFNGGELNYTFDNTVDGNAPLQTVNALYGFTFNDSKTRVMLSGHYSDQDPLTLQDRLNLVQRGISNIIANSPSFLYNSSNPFPGATPNIACQDANYNPTNCILRNGTSLSSPITYISPGAAPGSNLSAGLLANAGRYNLNLAPGTAEYGLQDLFGSVATTKSFMTTIRHEFTESLEAFTEFSTISNAGRSVYNPVSGSFFVPASAPTNPFQDSVLINFPSNISKNDTSDTVAQSVTWGLIEHLPGNWGAELDYTWSHTLSHYAFGALDSNTFSMALASGVVNPFADTKAYQLNLAPYFGSYTESSDSTLNDLSLRASGPIGSFPWGSPTLTVGLEHRKEGYHNGLFSGLYPTDPTSDFEQVQLGQSQTTNSLYAEALVPLVTAKNSLSGVQSLELQLAGRSERYTVFGKFGFEFLDPNNSVNNTPITHAVTDYTSTNPTIGLKYQPVPSVTLRASYSTAFLPPTPGELIPNPIPQCGPSPCVQITDPKNGESYLINYTGGGNPALRPQASRDWDLGVIWEPQQDSLKGLRLDLQHYTIIQPNYIVTNPLQQLIINAPEYASRVTRDPVTGLITSVNASALNATEYKTNGWDITMDYRRPTAVGTFGVHALATVIEHDLRQYEIGSPFLNYAGYPNDGGEAKTKANVTLNWEYRHWTLGWTTTYVSSYYQTGTPGSPSYIQNGAGGGYAQYQAQGGLTIPSQVYHNLFGSYTFEKGNLILSNLRIQFGVKNVFNTLPPFDANFGPYYYSPYGDPRLRDYSLSVRKAF